MRGCVLLAVLAVAVAPARAATIDASTVRVFAVGTVSAEEVELKGQHVTVANPVGGHGTGFVVEDGLVMTANHVIEGARHVVVRLPGKGGFFAARVVYAEKDNDVAVLALDTDGARPPDAVMLAKAAVRVRGTVFAVGYPIDAARTQPQSARGIIAGFLDDGTVQLDMALNPGNSGGPLVDERDAVVGMVVARGAVEKGVQGIGYAVPLSRLVAALAEARRRLHDGDQAAGAALSRDGAMVVDEIVQHGMIYELRKSIHLRPDASPAEVERALASLTSRIHDADLVVFVASALWNVAVALELADESELPPNVTRDQAVAIAARLRRSATAAARRAVQLDGSVGERSSFVQVALGEPEPAPDVATAPPQQIETFAPPPVPQGPSRTVSVALRGAPIARFNPESGTTAWGYGAGASFQGGRRGQRVIPTFGVAFGTVTVPGMNGDQFTHMLVAAELGAIVRLGRLDITGTFAPCWYQSSVSTMANNGAASAYAVSFRLALGLRLGPLELGAAARALTGPTVWIEPAYLAVEF